ncbi:hypothetical protein HAX54_044810 [Datura stramonium]|uniref:Pentatricopeptide repeat-containing protein n=1 Tax=Datura stramonium TaxID=4076 RepID=A0ABS8WIU4_DATST|nr:hypothetical protein [Datura stramonium]
MLMEGVVPNELTMASILKACSSLAALEQGKQIHAHIVKHGFSLEVPIGSALSTMYAKSGSLHDGNLVFRRMPARDLVSWNSMMRILLSAGRNYRNYELGAYAGEKLMELGSQESSSYVLLSSIYSALGRLEDVERVRRLMNIRGVNRSLDVAGLI